MNHAFHFALTRSSVKVLLITGAVFGLTFVSAAHAGGGNEGAPVFGLWEPFAPPQNPVTEEKRVLGKMLFWDEQLSSDNTVSCGTCHIPSEGGVDPRVGINPAFDGVFGTADDVIGSPGVIKSDFNGMYLRSPVFGLEPQVTPRRSMNNHVAMYAGNLFWDGRAEGNYVDPLTGEILAVSSAALEIQSLVPIMSNMEMAHDQRDWGEVTTKIANARPMALATDIPQDMLDAMAINETYPLLFKAAFGDPAVTPARIGFAIATYERTLVPGQSPWDLWVAGDPNGMSPKQLAGWTRYRNSVCNDCHVAPLFTTNAFTVNGIRPPFEDLGRSVFSGTRFEDGAFRMSSLRNIGLRDKFDHTGGFDTLDDVFDFYAHRNGRMPFPQNLDFRLQTPIIFSPADEEIVKHFLTTALTDPRVGAETFPFDRPTLYTEQGIPNPLISEVGNAGTGGFVPAMIAIVPPNIGNLDFKIGLDRALGGAQAWVAISTSPPSGGVVAQDKLVGPITLNGMSPGDGYGTLIYPLDDPAVDNQTFYMQWVVADPGAVDGFARSPVAAVTPFCSMIASCTPGCAPDLTGDGQLNFFDVSAFLAAFGAQDSAADFNGDGMFNFFDVSAFLSAFAVGCP